MSESDRRDRELNELERELKAPPHIESPDVKNFDGGACWLDKDRVCGPDCVAYNIDGVGLPEGEPVQGPNVCTVLVYAGQMGAGALATLALTRKQRQASDDARRAASASNPPIPKVMP